MKRALPILALAAAACTPGATGSVSPDSLDAAAATITPADVRDRIAFLASDELRGRATPSPGLETAARWIADELASFGLEPAGDDGWFQRYPYPAEALDADRTRLDVSAGRTHSFAYGTEFFARGGGPVASGVGVAVLGAGLTGAPEGSLRDRAVVVTLEGLPQAGRRGFAFTGETRAAIARTVESARAAGAAAVLFVLDAGITGGEVLALAEAEETPQRLYGVPGVDRDRGMPAFFLTRSAAERMLRMGGLNPSILDGVTPRPIPVPGMTVGLSAPIATVDDARPPNVVGLLPGSDSALARSYVVVSAHMDHLGVGRPDEYGDSIYNGADDDASGTSVLVEVAEALARLEVPPRRSVLFIAVSGEEQGLLGSRWFTDHPTVPIDSVVANLNVDMVGRNAPDSIVVIGQEFSSLGGLVRDVAARHRDDLGLTVSADPWPEQRFFFRSDHFNFARKEIPALFFFAGTHEDYHRPGDELEGVDTDKVARVGRLVFHLVHAIADDAEDPEWDPQGLQTVRSLTRD
ncbi:MAG: M28 family peptidase [Gemmatimonadota bacterium]